MSLWRVEAAQDEDPPGNVNTNEYEINKEVAVDSVLLLGAESRLFFGWSGKERRNCARWAGGIA